MNIVKKTARPDGSVRMIIELKDGESLRVAPKGRKLIEIDEDAYYRLGEPMDEVMPGNVLADAKRVHWCPIEQRWIA